MEINMAEQDQDQALPISLKVEFKNKGSLYKAYMPFLQNGGLFIPGKTKFKLRNPLNIELTLPEGGEASNYHVEGQVAWITPDSAQGRWTAGVGVEFKPNESNRRVREKINLLIAEESKTDKPTNTI